MVQSLTCIYQIMTEEFNQLQQSAPPTSRYIERLMCLTKFQSLTPLHDRIQWKHCNPEILKTVKFVNYEWDLKFYFLHMNSNEVGSTLKHPETIIDNVKNLSKRIVVPRCP